MNASIKRLGIEGISKKDMFGIAPHLLQVEPGFNLRFDLDPEHIAHFKQVIRAGGTIPPLQVRATSEKEIFIVDGHHRHAAVMELIDEGLEIASINCVGYQGSDADRIAMVLTSAEGKPLTPLEQAFGYQRLTRLGWSEEVIADRCARTVVRVRQLLSLACADTAIHELIRTGKISADFAIEVIRKHGSKAAQAINGSLDQVKEGGGKGKVTRATMNGRSLPKKVVTSLVEHVTAAAARVSPDTMAIVTKARTMPDNERAKLTVTVPVELLIGLVDAGGLIPKQAETVAAAA